MIKVILLAASVWAITTSSGISGMGANDQWGNQWLLVEISPDEELSSTPKAIVSIFDCDGGKRKIGEVPAGSLGSGNNYAGIRFYATASESDWLAVDTQSEWEKKCAADSTAMRPCDPNPRRDDCEVVERKSSNHALMIPERVWRAYDTAHPRKKSTN